MKGKGKGKEQKKRKVKPESEDEDEEEGDDDEETRRLRKRMAAAMAQGDDEDSEMEMSGSELGEDDDEDMDDDDEDEDEEMGSFHTDSEKEEGEEGEEEEEELDDADSEQLEDEGPLDDKTRQLRAKMQAMMEAAESRAKGDTAPPPPAKKSALKKTSTTSTIKAKLQADEEDSDAGYDLAPLSSFGKPLSAEVLRKAEESEKARLAQKAEKAALAKSQKTQGKRIRKKRKVEPNTKVISYVPPSSCKRTGADENRENKALHVLPPVLNSSFSSNGLPPILEPGMRVGSASKVHKNFYKGAMGNSGVRPGMGVMDGRKKRAAR